MPNSRTIAYDATFMIAYIGLSAAMVTLTLALFALPMLEIEFAPHHVAAAIVNVLGWSVLPFAPRLYKSLVGEAFSWRSNRALGGESA